MENPIKIHDLGVSPIFGNNHIRFTYWTVSDIDTGSILIHLYLSHLPPTQATRMSDTNLKQLHLDGTITYNEVNVFTAFMILIT